LSVWEDGSPVGNSPVLAPFQNQLHIVLDTTAMSNGVHQISGFASWNSGGDEGSDPCAGMAHWQIRSHRDATCGIDHH